MCTDQLISLQTRLAQREQEMENQIQQLTTEHEMNIKRLPAKHDAELERIRAGTQRHDDHYSNQSVCQSFITGPPTHSVGVPDQ